MTPERWERVQALFHEVADLEPEPRRAQLAAVSATDPDLVTEVRSLLDAEHAERLATGGAVPLAERLGPGTKVGEYVVEEELGAGAFGTVYRVRHPVIGKRAAVKVLNAASSAEPDAVRRFETEARAVHRIDHPNIVDVFGFGRTADGRYYALMELLEGEPLDRMLGRRGALRVEEAQGILEDLAAALDAAHDAGVVHRDLKPSNVFVHPDGRATLLDFGIAKLTRDPAGAAHTASGTTLGTPAYMAPEQVYAKPVDRRTDAYAFGVLTFEMLTGRLPFRGDSAAHIMVQHASAEPDVPDSLPGHVQSVLRSLLAKSPDARPDRLGPAVQELVGAAEAPGADVRPEPDAPRPPPRAGRAAWLGAAGLALIAAGAVSASMLRAPEPLKQTEAPTRAEAPPSAETPASPRPAEVTASEPTSAPEPARLVVGGAPQGTTIYGPEGDRLGVAPGPFEVKASDAPVLIRLVAPGYRPMKRTVWLRPGQRTELTVGRMKVRLHEDLDDPF